MTVYLPSWSEPYHGVQHLSGHPALEDNTYQVTVEAGAGFCTWYVLALHGSRPFTPVREGQSETPEAARFQAEVTIAVMAGFTWSYPPEKK